MKALYAAEYTESSVKLRTVEWVRLKYSRNYSHPMPYSNIDSSKLRKSAVYSKLWLPNFLIFVGQL